MNIDETTAQPSTRPTLEAAPSDTPSGYRRMLVPLDGSPLAEVVLPFVSRLARPLGLEIALLRVIPIVVPQVVEGSRNVIRDDTERLTLEAEHYLTGVADRLCADGFRTLTAVRSGEAATEILAGAHECQADLVAMTTHGRSGLGRLFFGSIAEAVLRRAQVPVFLVRTTAAERDRRAA
jgi:nucleotide-binding universal stress UspA family protein